MKNELIKKVEKLMEENGLYGDVYGDDVLICIDVEWGDWKHEHMRLDLMIADNFDIKFRAVEVTEEDGSDCYSATHKYVI